MKKFFNGTKVKVLPGSAFRNRITTTGFTQLVDFRLTKMFSIFARRQFGLSPRRKFTTGFTLIELLVVISIIGLLSSIVLASLQTAREKAQVSALRQDLYQLVTAIELYRSDNNGSLPFGGAYGYKVDYIGDEETGSGDVGDPFVDNNIYSSYLSEYLPKRFLPPTGYRVVIYDFNYPTAMEYHLCTYPAPVSGSYTIYLEKDDDSYNPMYLNAFSDWLDSSSYIDGNEGKCKYL